MQLARMAHYFRVARTAFQQDRQAGRPLGSFVMAAARILRQGGPASLAAALRGREIRGDHYIDYAGWIARHDRLDDAEIRRLREEISKLAMLPTIAALMPVYNTPAPLLREAIESVLSQVYERWELCIADDCSTELHVAEILAEYAGRDARIRWTKRLENGHISRASNSALELVRSEWVALLDHDDILRPNALAEVAMEIVRHPEAQLIYSDEDKLSTNGTRYDPFFKPDFSRELFRSQNYLNHLTVHRSANIRAVGGWRSGFEGSQDYDLSLRICERIGFRNIRHIPKVLYHWRAVPGSTAASNSEKSYAYDAGLRALREHVERLRLPALVEQTPGLPFYRLRFSLPSDVPLVSLIIPTRDGLELLRGSVGSILAKTSYPNYEIMIVDNGSTDPAALRYMDDLKSDSRIRVLDYDRPFNYSAINNFAVGQARGEIVGLINNDVEVISPDWLSEMASWAIQPDVGCVGAKLYYPDDTVQHAGVVLGVGGVANHAFQGMNRSSPGHFGRAAVLNNWSAVTGACLVVRRSVYLGAGGLDADNLPIAFNDVDLCLKVGELGLVNVWTPYAELYHHESASRGADDTPHRAKAFAREIGFMRKKWGLRLQQDPYYSINYSNVTPAFSLRQ